MNITSWQWREFRDFHRLLLCLLFLKFLLLQFSFSYGLRGDSALNANHVVPFGIEMGSEQIDAVEESYAHGLDVVTNEAIDALDSAGGVGLNIIA